MFCKKEDCHQTEDHKEGCIYRIAVESPEWVDNIEFEF